MTKKVVSEDKNNFAKVVAMLGFKKLEESDCKDMMATNAYHQLGDISRDEPDLCYIYGDDGENWVGRWATGYGFFDVKFPKETTRPLTKKEKEYWNKRYIQISNQPPIKVTIKD